MKLNLRASAAGIAIVAAVYGGLAHADQFTDKIVEDLQGQGYEYIEVKVGPTQVKAEAIKGSTKIEVVYDRETGKILKQETEKADGEDIGKTEIEVSSQSTDFIGEDGDDDDHDDVDDVDDDHDDDGHDDDDDGDDDEEEDDDDDDDDEKDEEDEKDD